MIPDVASKISRLVGGKLNGSGKIISDKIILLTELFINGGGLIVNGFLCMPSKYKKYGYKQHRRQHIKILGQSEFLFFPSYIFHVLKK